MINALNGVFIGVSKLEKIVNSIEFDNIYVYGELNVMINNSISSNEDGYILPIRIIEEKPFNLTSEYYESVIHNICLEYSSKELYSKYMLLGDSIDTLDRKSFYLTQDLDYDYKKQNLKEWMKSLNSMLENFDIKRYEEIPDDKLKKLSYDIGFSISIIETENTLDLLIIEGFASFSSDVEKRNEILTTLYPGEKISQISMKKFYQSILESNNIKLFNTIDDVVNIEDIELKLEKIIPSNVFRSHKYLKKFDKDILFIEILLYEFLSNSKLIIVEDRLDVILNPDFLTIK